LAVVKSTWATAVRPSGETLPSWAGVVTAVTPLTWPAAARLAFMDRWSAVSVTLWPAGAWKTTSADCTCGFAQCWSILVSAVWAGDPGMELLIWKVPEEVMPRATTPPRTTSHASIVIRQRRALNAPSRYRSVAMSKPLA
jgi:hypothetical protein